MECLPAGQLGLLGNNGGALNDVAHLSLAVKQSVAAEPQTGGGLIRQRGQAGGWRAAPQPVNLPFRRL